MNYDFSTLVPKWGDGAMMWRMLERQGISDPEVIDMGVAEMKFRIAPEIQDAVVRQATEGTFGYGFAPDEMKQAVCSWMRRRHGWETHPEELIQTYGVVSAIGYSLRALTKPGDGVLVMYPTYGPFPRSVLGSGRRLVGSDLVLENGRYVMDFDDLSVKMADKGTTALIFCSPHNPTGRVWEYSELERLAELCEKNGIAVISDEIHFDIVFPGAKHTVFATLPGADKYTVTLTAPSKTFNIAGMTVSNAVVSDEALRQKVKKVVDVELGHYINAFGFAACTAAYDLSEPWLRQANEVLKSNSDYLESFFSQCLPMLKLSKHDGTYLRWADFSALGLDTDALNALLKKKARFFSETGTDFGEAFGQFQRINFACPRSYLELACQRLSAAVSEL